MSQEQYIPARLIPYTKTLAQWTSSNPIPKQGELVGEVASPAGSSPNKLKVGDGVTRYLSLPYLTGGAGTPQSLQDTLNLGYTADLPGVNQIELNNTAGDTKLVLNPNGGIVGYYDLTPLRQTIGFHATTTPYFFIRDSLSTAFIGKIFAQAQTAAHVWGLPDKDGTFAMMSDVVAASSLQGVLNAGNTATEAGADVATLVLNKTSTNRRATLSASELTVLETVLNAYISLIIDAGTVPTLKLTDASGTYYTKLRSVSLSGNRVINLPDEGSGGAADDTLVIHTTKDTITVYNTGANLTVKMHSSGYFVASESVTINETREHNIVNYGNIWQYIDSSGSPYTYNHKLLPYLGADTGAPPAGGVTIENYLPQHNGEVMTNDGGNDSQVLVAAATMVVTHGAPFTPRMVSITATNAAAMTAIAAGYYISAKTSTTFTITWSAPVTATINIDYTVFQP